MLGLVVQSNLKTESLAAENLIAIDTSALAGALAGEPGAAGAGRGSSHVHRRLLRPAAGLRVEGRLHPPGGRAGVTTHLQLNVRDEGCEVQGGFQLTPTHREALQLRFQRAGRLECDGGYGTGECAAGD